MKMHKKSQSSMEFFALVGLAFLATILFVGITVNEVKEFSDQKEFLMIKDLALRLQKEVAIAASVEDGYERDFTLPDKLENSVDYYILTKNTSITINSSKTVFSAGIPVLTSGRDIISELAVRLGAAARTELDRDNVEKDLISLINSVKQLDKMRKIGLKIEQTFLKQETDIRLDDLNHLISP